MTLANGLRLIAAAAGDLESEGLTIGGDQSALAALMGVLDKPDPAFNIITP